MADRDKWMAAYADVRRRSEALCERLTVEDHCVQPFAAASPAKWNLAHTTWFFETLVLREHAPDYAGFDASFGHLFNSYYEVFGDRVPQAERGKYSRPAVEQVYAYRRAVDAAMVRMLDSAPTTVLDVAWPIIELGLHHEQQHQELMVTDVKAALFQAPVYPAWFDAPVPGATVAPAASEAFTQLDGGVIEIGHAGDGFAYDNESPRHRAVVEPFALANELITNQQYLAFMADGGYDDPQLWLSDGWAWAKTHERRAPMYWLQRDGEWLTFTNHGLQPLQPSQPVTHVSYYEAWAYARWSAARLPTEAEWEHAAVVSDAIQRPGTLLDDEVYHPVGSTADAPVGGPRNLIGEVWEWTESSYAPFPGYRPPPGAYGEYNGKFMVNQMVLRGGSCATARSHIRPTYRNFFQPDKRWQFTGIRLARS